MWQNVIGNHIRRANRNLFLTNASLLLIVCAVTAGNWRYLSNVLRGPAPMEAKDLVQIQNPESLARYFVEVTGLTPKPTGISYVKRKRGSETTEWVLLAARVGDRYLLIKAPEEAPGATYRGYLDIPAPELRSKLQESVPAAEYDRTFYPYLLDVTDFRTAGVLGMIAGGALALIALLNLRTWFSRSRDYGRSPIARQLSLYGTSPEAVAMAIDADFRQGAASPIPKTWFTRSWILRQRPFGLDSMHLGDLVWAYQKVTRHYYNFVPMGKTRELIFHDRNGRQIACKAGDKPITAAFEYLTARLPWIAYGYSAERDEYFKKDLAAFARSIDQRRSQFFAQMNEQARQQAGSRV